ncbi:hypothetical protein TNIN_273191 [Trichonephila inaurata madagascariensis]|uniref:Uncharacterized protein n=1 Tax=Trichonephila inaurata madagascariensis TaxID=2747483 RepID=A0A8X6MDV3_9ARAC|nr:hypothetical protein TNIN_273191 [Trichonephila inaurata madagascariensis]
MLLIPLGVTTNQIRVEAPQYITPLTQTEQRQQRDYHVNQPTMGVSVHRKPFREMTTEYPCVRGQIVRLHPKECKQMSRIIKTRSSNFVNRDEQNQSNVYDNSRELIAEDITNGGKDFACAA